MSIPGLLQVALYVVLLILITRPVGLYMARVFSGERTFLDPLVGPVERAIYRVTAVDLAHLMTFLRQQGRERGDFIALIVRDEHA